MIHLLHLAHSDFLCFRLPSCWKRAARHSRKPTRHPDGDLFWALRCWAQTNTQTKKHCQSWLEETEEISTRKSRKKDNNPGIGGCFIFIGWFIQLVVCVSSVWVWCVLSQLQAPETPNFWTYFGCTLQSAKGRRKFLKTTNSASFRTGNSAKGPKCLEKKKPCKFMQIMGPPYGKLPILFPYHSHKNP